MVQKVFDKKSSGSGAVTDEINYNLQLAEKLPKLIIRKLKKQFTQNLKTIFGGGLFS